MSIAMKKRALFIAALVCAGSPHAVQARTTDGEVVAAPGTECSDYFAVKTGDRYVLLEWFGGPAPSKGDKVQGEFDTYGVKAVSLLPGGAKMRAWVEDYDLTIDTANDKLKAKCK